jgi:hypothetical protein
MPGFEVVHQICEALFASQSEQFRWFWVSASLAEGVVPGVVYDIRNQNINTSHPLCLGGSQDLKMASIVRPAMLRQTCFAATSKRTFSTKLSSSFPTKTKPAASVLLRPVVRNALVKDALPGAVRVAAFHASGRRAILPPLPRKLKLQSQLLS